MGNIRVEGKKIIYQRKDELTIIEPYGMNCLRCRSTKTVKFLIKTGLYCLLLLPMTATLNVTADSQPSQMEL